jgi:hypothetical protein
MKMKMKKNLKRKQAVRDRAIVRTRFSPPPYRPVKNEKHKLDT